MNPVHELRHRAGLTQALLSQASGVSPSMISSYETGRRIPRLDILQRIAESVGFDVVVSFHPVQPTEGVEERLSPAPPVADVADPGATANASSSDPNGGAGGFEVVIGRP